MKFLCLVIVDETKLAALPPQEAQELDDISLAYDGTLRQSGHFLAAQALQSVSRARMVRIRDGQVVVKDGPFAETREQVGGFILVEARDMDEAVGLAAKIPAIRLGGVEVRPIQELTASNGEQG